VIVGGCDLLKTLSGRRASQNEYELRSFIQLMKERGVTRYLEIGARHGDSFHEIVTNLPKGGRYVAVDLPGGLWGKPKSVHALRNAVSLLQGNGYDAHMILANSQEEATAKAIAEFGPFDAILIDGDHTYQGVLKDWILYGGMAPLIAFHDVVGQGQSEKIHGNPVEVPILWEEIKASGLETVEFIDEGSAMGIGVVCK
jgi:predicted O-methyltransferase YrrM